MGIYADYANEYWESGLNPVPIEVDTKICRVYESDKHFFNKFLSETDLNKWIDSHGEWNVGIACGKTSGYDVIDFDYEENDFDTRAQVKVLEDMLLGCLPPSHVIKKGKKGWSRFYKHNPYLNIKHISRNKLAFVDFLTTGSYTIMPPSGHPDNKYTYRWMTKDTLLDIDKDDLTMITQDHLDHIEKVSKYSFDEIKEVANLKPEGGRHNTIFAYVLRRSDHVTGIDELVADVMSYDIAMHKEAKKGPWHLDEGLRKGKSVSAFVKHEVTRFIDWKIKNIKETDGVLWSIGSGSRVYWIEGKNGPRRSEDYLDFKHFFSSRYGENTRVDVVSGGQYYKRAGKGEFMPILNDLDIIKSQAHSVGLNENKCQMHIMRWLGEMKPRLLVDIPEWDQKDHLAFALDKMEIGNISHEYFCELMKEWLGLCFSRCFNSSIQNRFIVLKGHQGVGKDFWISKIFEGLADYYSDVSLDQNKADVFKSINPLIVGNIPEFDETKATPISTLKMLVTSQGQTYRDSYARSASKKKFKTSFISSCNFENILRDTSGNRRFMIFDVESIVFGWKGYNPMGVMSQAMYYAKSGYRASDEARAAMDAIILELTPDDPTDLFFESVNEMLKERSDQIKASPADARGRNNCKIDKDGTVLFRWSQIETDVSRIGRAHGYMLKRCQTILKTRGVTKKGHSNIKYYRYK